MKKTLSVLLALIMCLTLCACGKSEAASECENLINSIGKVSVDSKEAIEAAENAYKALTEKEKTSISESGAILSDARKEYIFELSKAAYTKINTAYKITDPFGSDIYDVWKSAIYNEDEIKKDDVNYLVNSQGLFLTEEELRDGIAYTFVLYAYPEGWDDAPEDEKQSYYEKAGSVLRTMIRYYNDDFMSFCVNCVTNAYSRSGKVETASAALDEAKVMMKELSEKYSDYEHYPNLKKFYTTTISYFDFCQNPTGSFDQYTTTMNDYKNSIRDYISDLDYIFEE